METSVTTIINTSRAPKKAAGLFLFIGLVIFIIGFSFAHYAPCNYAHYNSDHAIHVLMAEDFQLPRDLYFWGQRRLGSLLPMLAHPVGKIIPVHYLYITSVVHYLMLTISFYIMASRLRSLMLRIAMCAVIFLPVNEYNALILIGHPYSSQLFAGSLLLFNAALLRNHFVADDEVDVRWQAKALLLLILSFILFAIGVWVSELSGVLAFTPFMFVILDKDLKQAVVRPSRRKFVYLLVMVSLMLLIGMFLFYGWMRSTSDVTDLTYDRTFLDNGSDVLKQFGFFLDKLDTSLFYKDARPIENTFNWFILVLIAAILKFRQDLRSGSSLLVPALIITCVVATIALFLSTWNFRSEFGTRYFTPLYVILCFVILLSLDRIQGRHSLKRFATSGFVLIGIVFCYASVIRLDTPTPFQQYNEYQDLPDGTLIGDFWDVYKINSVAIDNLSSIPFETNTVRNWGWRDEVLDGKNFYFLKNQHFPNEFGERIVQFGRLFAYSGTSYYCNGNEVMLYHLHDTLHKFRLKDSRGLYIIRDRDDVLFATLPDSVGAEVFELISSRSGTSLKASNGYYVRADLSNDGRLIANQDHAWDWELFQILPQDGRTVALWSRMGPYVSADRNKDGLMIADRQQPLEWELFEMEPINDPSH